LRASLVRIFLQSHRQHHLLNALLPTANPNHPESALNSVPTAVLQRARGDIHAISACLHLSLTNTHRPRCIPSAQGWFHVQWESWLWPGHRPTSGRIMVCALVHSNRRTWLGPPNRRGHHRFCDRTEQRGRSKGIQHGRKRHYWRKHQRCSGPHRHRRECPGYLGSPCTHVLVLEIQG
jgi:hypothetical protein